MRYGGDRSGAFVRYGHWSDGLVGYGGWSDARFRGARTHNVTAAPFA